MRAIVFDVNVRSTYETDIKNYKEYYKHLKCDLFDVVYIKIGNEDATIFVDDEGMMKSGTIGCLVEGYSQPLFGNMVFTGGVDEDGETLPLSSNITHEDIYDLISMPMYIVK